LKTKLKLLQPGFCFSVNDLTLKLKTMVRLKLNALLNIHCTVSIIATTRNFPRRNGNALDIH